MTIAVLAVQGAFIEHIHMLQDLDVRTLELRNEQSLLQPFDGLILPGGESTTQGKLLHDLGMFAELQEKIKNGLPVLATCAGMILLASHLRDDVTSWFATCPITVKRNAYGRQLGSFFTRETFGNLENFPMHFIRAPYIESVEDNHVRVLATVDNHMVGVQYYNQIALSFHSEVSGDNRIHRHFLQVCQNAMHSTEKEHNH